MLSIAFSTFSGGPELIENHSGFGAGMRGDERSLEAGSQSRGRPRGGCLGILGLPPPRGGKGVPPFRVGWRVCGAPGGEGGELSLGRGQPHFSSLPPWECFLFAEE